MPTGTKSDEPSEPGATEQPSGGRNPTEPAKAAGETAENTAKPAPGVPGSAEHRAAAWREYQESFKPGGPREGKEPLPKEQWDAKYTLNMERMNRSTAGVNKYREQNAPWAEKGEVYLKKEDLPRGVDARHFDIGNRDLKRAIEFKEFQGGKRAVASMNNDIKGEIAADKLLRGQKGWDIKWIFKGYKSISSGLAKALDDAKIPYEIIP